MKKIYIFFLLVLFTSFAEQVTAQCSIQLTNMAITQPSSPIENGSKCQFTFSFSFDIVQNGGFKYFYMHSWLENDYPSPSVFNCNNNGAQFPGTSSQYGTAVDAAGKSFLDLGFENLNGTVFPANTPVDITSKFATVFDQDPAVVLTQPSNSPGLEAIVTRKGNSDTLHFDITNIRVIINGACNTPIMAKTDVWAGNSNRPDPPAQCKLCGLVQSFNDPKIALVKSCSFAPFRYQIGLTSLYPDSDPIQVVYKIYLHNPLLASVPTSNDTLVFTSPLITLSAGQPFTSDFQTLPHPYCCVDPWAQYSMYARVTSTEFSNIFQSQVIEPGCAALPVQLRTFTAARDRASVMLKWTTESEINNKGFEVQRKIGPADWENVGFVSSRSTNGNSNQPLNYELTDLNNVRGVTQYRLKQVDIDGKISYSMIRSVRGDGQKGSVIIYPNPSADGKINIVFDNKNTTRDVSVLDMNGRVVRQWKGVANNNLQADNLVTGIYTVRIVDTESGEVVVEKFVVKNR